MRISEIWSITEGKAFGGSAVWSNERDDPVGVLQHFSEEDEKIVLALPRIARALVALDVFFEHIGDGEVEGGDLLRREIRDLVKSLGLDEQSSNRHRQAAPGSGAEVDTEG